MHTEIKYTGSETEKETRAMADIQDWLGKRYTEIHRDFKGAILHEDMDQRIFRSLCGMAGIQGYPVRVWWRKLQDEIANEQ